MNRIAHHINLLASPTAASAASGSGVAGASVPIILSGDIGGTRSRLQLWKAPSPPSGWGDSGRVQSIPGALLFEQKYLNASFGSFVDPHRDAVWALKFENNFWSIIIIDYGTVPSNEVPSTSEFLVVVIYRFDT